MQVDDEKKGGGLAADVSADLSGGEAVLAERIAELMQGESRSAAPEGFAQRVIAAVEEVRFRGKASRRYERITESQKRSWRAFSAGYRKTFVAAAALVFAILGLSVYWRFEQAASSRAFMQAMLMPASVTGMDPEKRRRQRVDGYEMEVSAAVTDGTADVSRMIPNGPVYLVGQRDDVTGEVCIFAYSESQWRTLDEMLGGRGDRILKETWNFVREHSRLADVVDGKLDIPEDMWQDFLDGSDMTSMLKFSERSEFWEPVNLQEYRRGSIIIKAAPEWNEG
ncbi:MAG: hypothetical protein JW909_10370 [Planctomycetes bacterium]|nr:hypothetical protein [Planctomycetota bacterium]